MKYFPLEPVATQITDPETEIVYTLTATPPDEDELADIFSVPIADLALDTTLKEFVQLMCWRALRIPKLEQMRTGSDEYRDLVGQLLPLLTFGVDAITADEESVAKSYYNVSYGELSKYSPTPGIDQPPSIALCKDIALRVSRSPVVEEFVLSYLGHQNLDLPDSSLGDEPGGGAASEPKVNPPERQTTLFPNKRIGANQIGVVQVVANALNSLGGITRTLIKTQQDEAIRDGKRALTKVSIHGSTDTLSNGEVGQRWVELEIRDDSLVARTAEEYTNELLRIKNPAELQCLLALWALANQQDSAGFEDVPLSQLMKLILKDKNPNKRDRQQFTQMLEWFNRMTISVHRIVPDETKKKGGKGKVSMVLKKIEGIPIFRMEATYSVRQQFRHLPKELLTREHFDLSVITKFSGRLLPMPKHAYLFVDDPASTYMTSLLRLDGNKDKVAILAGFYIQTRFNQKLDKGNSVDILRSQLIERCGYEKTNARQASQATGYLINVFDKLIAAGVISRYEGLTNVDTDRVSFYPPPPTAIQAG